MTQRCYFIFFGNFNAMKLECFIYFLNVLLESNGMQLEFTDFEIDVFNNILKTILDGVIKTKRVQDGEHMYTCGRFILIYGKTNTIM